MEKKEVWVAEDGTAFDLESDCREYEIRQSKCADVDDYLDEKASKEGKEMTSRRRSRQKNLLLDFVGWQAVASQSSASGDL